MDDSPTARALLALELVQGSPGITADRLADKLGVSERAARRYVAILREAGIPIESVRGPYGGYRLGRGLRLPPLTFSATEALGLVMAVLDGHHAASDPTDPVGSALGKIMRALPEPVAAQAEALRRRPPRPPPTGPPYARTRASRPLLVQACSERRRVRVGYRSEAGSEWAGEVDPWAVVVRHGRWYLLCHAHSSDARRAYRIDRIRDVQVLDAGFDRPADLDPVAELEEHLAVGWEYDVDVLVDAPARGGGASHPPRPRPARGGRRAHHPAGRQHQQPDLVRRAARGRPGAVPGGRRRGAPGVRGRPGPAPGVGRLLTAGQSWSSTQNRLPSGSRSTTKSASSG